MTRVKSRTATSLIGICWSILSGARKFVIVAVIIIATALVALELIWPRNTAAAAVCSCGLLAVIVVTSWWLWSPFRIPAFLAAPEYRVQAQTDSAGDSTHYLIYSRATGQAMYRSDQAYVAVSLLVSQGVDPNDPRQVECPDSIWDVLAVELGKLQTAGYFQSAMDPGPEDH